MYGTYSNKTKEWNGLVGMLMHNKIDIQVTGLNWLAERDELIDYVMPVLSSRKKLVAKVSQEEEIQVWVYLNIFSYDVWSTLGLTLIALSCFLFILHNFGYDLFLEQGKNEIIFMVIAASVRQLIQMPYEMCPMHMSSRISILVFSIGLYVLFAHYTCNLTANMVATPQKEDINSLKDAAEQGFTIGVVAGTSSEFIVGKLAQGTGIRVERLLQTNETDYTSLLSKFLESEPNGMMYSSDLDTINIDGIYSIDIEESYKQEVSFTLQKNSPYSQLFNYHLQRMNEKGMLHRLQQKHLSKPDRRQSLDPPFSLGYNNIVFPFLVIIFGCTAALLTSLFEKVIKLPNFEDDYLEKDPGTHLEGKTRENGHVDNFTGCAPLLAATKRILELETDRDKLHAEILELRYQLGCSHHVDPPVYQCPNEAAHSEAQ